MISDKVLLKLLWLEIPLEMFMRLIEPMPKHVQACYRAAGRHFKALNSISSKLICKILS